MTVLTRPPVSVGVSGQCGLVRDGWAKALLRRCMSRGGRRRAVYVTRLPTCPSCHLERTATDGPMAWVALLLTALTANGRPARARGGRSDGSSASRLERYGASSSTRLTGCGSLPGTCLQPKKSRPWILTGATYATSLARVASGLFHKESGAGGWPGSVTAAQALAGASPCYPGCQGCQSAVTAASPGCVSAGWFGLWKLRPHRHHWSATAVPPVFRGAWRVERGSQPSTHSAEICGSTAHERTGRYQ